MRQQILRCGGEVHFQTLMKRFILRNDTIVGVEAEELNTGKEVEFRGPVILATGHSARDVYRYLASARIEIAKANELLDLDLPESDEYLTVGGLILHEYQSFPKLNEVVKFGQFEFKILQNTTTKIELVRLKVLN